MKKAADIDEYISGFPKPTRVKLEQVRSTIRKTAPLAEELISYGIPAFKLNGYQLVYFAGFKNHIGLYPAPVKSDVFKKELSHYKTGKGSVQFPLADPIPLDLVKRIVQFREKENEERIRQKAAKKVTVLKKSARKKTDEDSLSEYLDQLDEDLREKVEAVRKIIKKTLPLLEERIKWNAPSYHLRGTDLFSFGPMRKQQVMLVFHHPAITRVESDLLEGNFKDRRLMHFKNLATIKKNKKELIKILSLLQKLVEEPS